LAVPIRTLIGVTIRGEIHWTLIMLYAILALVIAGFVVLIGREQLFTKKPQAYPYTLVSGKIM